MNRQILFIILILCVVQIEDVKSTEIFKDAFNVVKNTAKNAVHSVTRFFLPNHHHHRHTHDDNEENTEIDMTPTTPPPILIDVRSGEVDDLNKLATLEGTPNNNDPIPDLHSRTLIGAPCKDNMRSVAGKCREVVSV